MMYHILNVKFITHMPVPCPTLMTYSQSRVNMLYPCMTSDDHYPQQPTCQCPSFSLSLFKCISSGLPFYKFILDIPYIPEPSVISFVSLRIITLHFERHKCSAFIHQLIHYQTFPAFSTNHLFTT